MAQPNRPHELRFPFDQQPALAVWRALFFRPARFEADPARDRRMEPRRLPGRDARPLQRLPLAPQRLRRDRRRRSISPAA